jgi:UDPglucose 6-dehydrogenase
LKITIVGTGYVGLITGVCLADFGHNVICIDSNSETIDKLCIGEIHLYEAGLDIIIKRNIDANRIKFSTDIKKAIEDSQAIFLAVGTPMQKNGEADVSSIINVAESIGKYINEYKTIINKSTVPVGTGKRVQEIISNNLRSRKKEIEFDIVSNPEFLREGRAIYDFTHPDRIVIGASSEKAKIIMKNIYNSLYLLETPFIFTNIETAEIIKYASNAFLAMKITYINEVANLCEKVGANVKDVATAIGKDGRIGTKFLHAGPGYGGSCFPKDTMALLKTAIKYDVNLSLVDNTIKANNYQKRIAPIKIEKILGNINDRVISILGLTFKPETDDIRESPSLSIIKDLLGKGARIRTYCPKGMPAAKNKLVEYENEIIFCKNIISAAQGADCIVVITEWNEFRNIDFIKLKCVLNKKIIFDLRNIYEREYIEQLGYKYIGTGV